MYLIVDVGNSRAKVVVMENNEILYQAVSETIDNATLSEIVGLYGDIDSAIISTTRGNGNNLKAMVEGHSAR